MENEKKTIVKSTRMGEIPIQETDIVKFPHGLPGFLEEKTFIMLTYQSQIPFFLLQSTITPELTFVLADPFEFFKDYQFKIDDETVDELELNKENHPEIYSIITVPPDVKNMTANLLAPVIINRPKMTGKQIILERTNYTTRHRLFPNGLDGKASGKEKS